jgi:hypothetical protein
LKIIERHNRFDVISTTDPKLTIVSFTTRGHAEDFVARRSTRLENLVSERRGGKTAASGGASTATKDRAWGWGGRYA